MELLITFWLGMGILFSLAVDKMRPKRFTVTVLIAIILTWPFIVLGMAVKGVPDGNNRRSN